jgi:hypothetical protein
MKKSVLLLLILFVFFISCTNKAKIIDVSDSYTKDNILPLFSNASLSDLSVRCRL